MMHGTSVIPSIFGAAEPSMARDDDVVFVEDQRNAEAEFLDRLGDRLDRCIIDARVLFVGDDLIHFLVNDVHFVSFLLQLKKLL